MAKWDGRPGAGRRQVWKPAATNDHAPTRMAVAATPAGLRAQPLVPGARQPQWWPLAQDGDYRSSAKASCRTLEVRDRGGGHRRRYGVDCLTTAFDPIPKSTGL